MNIHKGYVLAQVIRVERLPSLAGIWRILQGWHELARMDNSALKSPGLFRTNAGGRAVIQGCPVEDVIGRSC